MTVIAAIQVDLTSTTVGTACRLANVIAGKSILRHTIDRVERISSVEVVCVLCPTGQKEACQNLLAGSKVRIIAYDAEPAPWTPALTGGRSALSVQVVLNSPNIQPSMAFSRPRQYPT
ncbi:MAG: hypothetical protein IIB57_00160 [Planctomycetes bacterium]|nr:hypothetical protein [Planctomycetota bacterium]